MDQATRARLEHNIFHAAHQACEPWEDFSWDMEAHAMNSSQALAIDVFGSLKTAANRDALVDALAETMGLPTGGPWDITLGWTARASLLNEPSPTQVDVYAESPSAVILFQCKFSEPDEDTCSQIVKRKGTISCDGNYRERVTLEHDMTSRCALSDQGIQYWNIIPKVFHLDAEAEYQPCPFAGSAYQWMRNLVVAYKVGRQKNKQPAVVIVYADHPALPMAQKVTSEAWTAFAETVRQDHVSLHVRSYQEILKLAEKGATPGSEERTVWQELSRWVETKISANSRGGRKPKRKRSSSDTLVASRNG